MFDFIAQHLTATILIGWSLSGLIIYLITWIAVVHRTDDWADGEDAGDIIFTFFGYLIVGPFGLFFAHSHVVRANRVLERQRQSEIARREEDELALIYGPNELDDYKACCQIKRTIQAAIYQSEKQLAELKLQPNPDKYILEFMPELEHTPSPASVREEQLKVRLDKLQASLGKTQARIDQLTEGELKRRQQAEAQRQRDQELARQQEERKAEEQRRETERQRVLAAEEQRIHNQALLNAERRSRQVVGAETNGLDSMSMELAVRLCDHEAHLIQAPDLTGKYVWIYSVLGLINSLDHDLYNEGYLENRGQIVAWFKREFNDQSLAAQLTNCNDPVDAKHLIQARLQQAMKLRELYQEELLRLRCPELDDADDTEQSGSAPEEELVAQETGAADPAMEEWGQATHK